MLKTGFRGERKGKALGGSMTEKGEFGTKTYSFKGGM